MRKELSKKILQLQEAAMEDETYRQLMDEHGVRNERFLQVVQSLSEEQQTAIFDYLGVLIEMHLRMLEQALT